MSVLVQYPRQRGCSLIGLVALFALSVGFAPGTAAAQQMPGMPPPATVPPLSTKDAPPMAPMPDMPSPPTPPEAASKAMSGMSTSSNDPQVVPPVAMAPMQGGQAPVDARDPFAYSGGYQRSLMPGAEASDGLWVGAIFIEQLEAVETVEGTGSAWDVQARYGEPFNKLWLRTQGDRRQGKTEAASAEALWFRMYDPFWGTQVGVRHDFGEGPSRTWAAFGIQGVAPYWIDIEATAYLGEGGRTSARLKAAVDLRLTQNLVLRPDIEANLYGRSDRERLIGSGLSSAQLGLRLRYEIRREFAPYVGLVWARGFGETGDLRRASSGRNDEVQAVVGVQIWQ